MVAHLTMDDVQLRERPAYWNYLVSSVLGRLTTIPQREGLFTGSIAHSRLSSIPIAQVSSTQLRVVRPEKFIDQPNEDFFKVNFQLAGQATLLQGGKQAFLQPGDWLIYDNMRPYELCFHADYKQLLFLVPRRQLLHLMPTIDLRLGQVHSSRSGLGKLLFDFAASGLQAGDTISAETQPQTARMLLDLLLLNLADTDKLPAPLPNTTRYMQVTQFVAAHLHHAELSAEFIARHLHLSKRTVQQLFAQHETTVQRYIWQQRLRACQRDLANPQHADQSVQSIAYRWGFRSSAHFARLFKKQFGETPTAYRHRHK